MSELIFSLLYIYNWWVLPVSLPQSHQCQALFPRYNRNSALKPYDEMGFLLSRPDEALQGSHRELKYFMGINIIMEVPSPVGVQCSTKIKQIIETKYGVLIFYQYKKVTHLVIP